MEENKILAMLTNVVKKPISKILIVVLIVAIVVFTMFASFLDLDVQNAKLPTADSNEDNIEYPPYKYYEGIYLTKEGTLMAEISVQDVWDSDSRYSQYLSSVDALAYFLNAQVVTQFPYIESASATSLNGTIRFYRNESTVPMSYVTSEQIDEYVEKYNEKGDNEALLNALSSFSVNEDGTIKVAYLQEETDTVTTNDSSAATKAEQQLNSTASNADGVYTIYRDESYLYTTNIAYRNIVQNYTLPFELLWAIICIGDDGSTAAGNVEDLARSIASMAYDGQIRLIIDDNSMVTTTTDRYTYNLEEQAKYFNITLVGEDGRRVRSNAKRRNRC